MYQFRIIKLEDEGYRFELGGIKMLINGYDIVNGKHSLINPDKAFAYFSFDNNVYGISNEPGHSDTAEDFYDIICEQYMVFVNNNTVNEEGTVPQINSIINKHFPDNNTTFKRSA